MSGERAFLAEWRNALRDSELDTTAKLVGFVISTFWTKTGNGAYPARSTIATGASLRSVRAVDYAIQRLERAGFLDVAHTRGGNSVTNTYSATLPAAHDDAPLGRTGVQGSESSAAHLTTANGASDDAQRRTGVHTNASESEMNAYTRADARKGKKTTRLRAVKDYEHSEYDRAG